MPYSATTFEYKKGCPGKGQYTLANLIFGCGDNSSWIMMAGDHTGDVGGNYMLVNAENSSGSITPAVIHVDTANGLCSGIPYVFSAWVTNVMRDFSCGGNAVLPGLTFTVKTKAGVVIATYDTGNIPITGEKEWKEYGLSFQLPAGESAVILMVSTNKKFGCGQGFAIDDITLRTCGPEVTATINDQTDPLEVCADYADPFILKGSYADGISDPVVQWQSSLDSGKTWSDIPSANSITYTIPHRDIGVVLYRLAVAERSNINSLHCRIISNVLYTSVNPVASHHAPQDLIGCQGKDLLLPEKDPWAVNLLWTGPNGYSSTLDKSMVTSIKYADTGLYTLKQEFLYGCTALDSFYVKVYPATTLSVPPVYAICEGQGVMLAATGEGTFNWQPATGLSNTQVANTVASPRDTTQYKVVVTNTFGCKDSAYVTVNVFNNPEVSVGTDRTIVTGDTVMLNGNVNGTATSFSWSTTSFMDNNQVLNPKVFPPIDMQYTLTAYSTVGCGQAEATVRIKVYNDLFIPSAFSPNKDGKNDHFKIVAADGYKLLQFQVYNRWGQAVFKASDFSKGWDGTFNKRPQPAGTYVYFLQILSAAGKTITRKGTITLIL